MIWPGALPAGAFPRLAAPNLSIPIFAPPADTFIENPFLVLLRGKEINLLAPVKSIYAIWPGKEVKRP